MNQFLSPQESSQDRNRVGNAAAIFSDVRSRYPQLDLEQAVASLDYVLEALLLAGLLDDPEGERVGRLLMERDVRLRLGLDTDRAHLDPQTHPARTVTP